MISVLYASLNMSGENLLKSVTTSHHQYYIIIYCDQNWFALIKL